MNRWHVAAGAAVLAASVAVYLSIGPDTPPPPPPPPPPVPKAPPAMCLMPGPAPAVPDGATASTADMQLGHDAIQHFVHELEAYQACRDAQADNAPPGTTEQQKHALIDQGDAAIDQANALAAAFSAQLKVFNARDPK